MSKLARCEGVKTYISLATDVGAFKFLVVQLFDGNLQITGSFEFHKAEVSISQNRLIALEQAYPLPSRSRPTSE